MSHPEGTAPAIQGSFPYDKNFAVEIQSDNYPSEANLILNNEDGKPVVRYRVGSKEKPILEQIVAISASIAGSVQFVFTLDSPTPKQIAEGYIAGKYTFIFVPPGNSVAVFSGMVKDPHKPGSSGEEDEWIAKGGGSDDDETSEC